MTVVDNGVIVDLFLARLRADQLGASSLAAPHLIDAEFMHVVRRHNRSGALTDKQALRFLARFEEMTIDRYPHGQLRRRTWELRHNLTAYDAMYVALAESLETKLITTDARIARAPGIRCPVEVL